MTSMNRKTTLPMKTMKHTTYALLLLFTGLSGAHAETDLAITPRAAPPKSNTEVFFEVSKGEALINGEVIREFAIGKNRVTVAYKNTTEKRLSPKYTIRIYNRYGLLLGSDDVSSGLLGGSPHLEPGDIGGDQLHVEWTDLNAIFNHSSMGDLPDDFQHARWLSIADSNSKVEHDGADQPAAVPESKPEGNEKD